MTCIVAQNGQHGVHEPRTPTARRLASVAKLASQLLCAHSLGQSRCKDTIKLTLPSAQAAAVTRTTAGEVVQAGTAQMALPLLEARPVLAHMRRCQGPNGSGNRMRVSVGWNEWIEQLEWKGSCAMGCSVARSSKTCRRNAAPHLFPVIGRR